MSPRYIARPIHLVTLSNECSIAGTCRIKRKGDPEVAQSVCAFSVFFACLYFFICFIARRHASAAYAVVVCLSVCRASMWQTQMSNYRLFVPKTFRSQERKVPMENFRSRGTKVPWNFRSRALSFSGTFVPGERKFPGTFVPGTFRTRELSFPVSDRPSCRFALCA